MNRVLFRQLDPGDGPGSAGYDPERASADELLHYKAVRTGLKLFLMVVTSLFFLFLIAFLIRSQVDDWQPLTAAGAPLADPWPLWLTTSLLLLSSIALHWGRVCARENMPRLTGYSMAFAGLFAIAFLIGQLWVWQLFVEAGFRVSDNAANSFFYLLTGLHGLHLLGGVVFLALIVRQLWAGIEAGQPWQRITSHIQLCSLYWHYLFVLWVVLFVVLTSSPETYRAIAELCGLR